jgi:hypothetical protein
MHVLMRVLPAYLLTRESKKCDHEDILTSTSKCSWSVNPYPASDLTGQACSGSEYVKRKINNKGRRGADLVCNC